MVAPLHVLLVAGPEVDAPAVLHALREAGYEPKAALAPNDAAIDEALAHRAWDVALFVPAPGAPGLMERILRVNVAQPDVPVVVVGAGEDGVADEAVPAATAEWLGPAIGRVLAAAPVSLDELLLTATEPAPEPTPGAAPEPGPGPAAETAPDAAPVEADDRLRVVQDLAAHLPIGLYQSTPDGRVLYANEALPAVLGFQSLDDLKDLDVRRDIGYPREVFEEQMRRFGEVRNLVVCWTDRQGRTVYTRENARVVRGADGAVLYYEGTMEDVTADHGARERDRQRTDQLAAIVRFAAAVDEARDLPALLAAAVEAVESTTGAPRVVVTMTSPGEEPAVATNADAAGIDWPALLAKVPVDGAPCLALDLARHDGPLPSAVRAPLRARGVQGLAAFPLFHSGRAHGAFYLLFDRPAVPAGEDVQVAETLAWHIAGALARHRAESGLRDSEACLRFIGEHTDHVLYRRRYDPQSVDGGSFDYLSPAIEALLGFTPAELNAIGGLGALVEDRDVVEGGGLMDAPPTPEQLAGDGTPPRYVARYRMQTRGGETRWVENLAYVWCDDDGTPVGLIGTLTDATERRRRDEERADAAVHALAQQKALVELAALGDAPPDAFIRHATRMAAAVVGVDRVSVWELAPDGSGGLCRDHYLADEDRHTLDDPLPAERFVPWLGEYDRHRSIALTDAPADPRMRPFGTEAALRACGIGAVLAAAVRRHGRPVGVVALHHLGGPRTWEAAEQDFVGALADVISLALERAERERAEAALREEELRYRAISELTSDYAFALRRLPDGRDEIVWATDAFARVTGYRPEEIDGAAGLLALIHPDCARHLQTAFARLAAGKAVDVEVCIVTKSGEERWVHHRARPGEHSADGAIVFYHGGEDVTERKRAEQELIAARVQAEAAKEEAEELARLKSAFLANMSHEIRTPLTGILGYAGILAEEVDAEHRESVELIERCGHRLLDTLNSVLELARLEGGGIRPTFETLDLASEVRQAGSLLLPLAEQKGLALTLYADTTAAVRLDRTCLARTLTNLIGNAIKFTDEGGIDVEVTTDETHAHVRVSDTGVGIDAAFIPHLFDEFRQETLGHARSHEGVGLGLAITKRLVDILGGTIEVQSRKGEGSTFTLSFPVAAASPAEAPGTEAPAVEATPADEAEAAEPEGTAATEETAVFVEEIAAEEAIAFDDSTGSDDLPFSFVEEAPLPEAALLAAPAEHEGPAPAPEADAVADEPDDAPFSPADAMFETDTPGGPDTPFGEDLLSLIFPSSEAAVPEAPASGDGGAGRGDEETFLLRWDDEPEAAPPSRAPDFSVTFAPEEPAESAEAFFLSDLSFGDDAVETPGVYSAGSGSALDAHFADDGADHNGMDGAGSWLLGAATPEEFVVVPAAEPPPPSAYVSFEEPEAMPEAMPVVPSGPPSLLPAVMEADTRPAILVVEDNDDTRALLEHILRSQYRVTAVGDARAALDHLHKTDCDGLVLDINLGGKQTGADILRIARTLPGNERIFAVALTAYALPGDRERFLQAGFDQYVSKPFTRSTLMAALREGVPGAA